MESMTDDERNQPSANEDDYWVESRNSASETAETGKWLLFYPRAQIDERWRAAKAAAKLLGLDAKCSTRRPNPRASGDDAVVVFYAPLGDAPRLGLRLRDEMKFEGLMYYKTAKQTEKGTRATGATENHKLLLYPHLDRVIDRADIVRISVVGFRYRSARVDDFVIGFENGSVRFEKEPTNKYDPNAIKVLVADRHVGYVAREDVPKVAHCLDAISLLEVIPYDHSVIVKLVNNV